MKVCGAPRCPVCVLPYAEARALPQPEQASGILWHLAGTGEVLAALSFEARLIVKADLLRRRMERWPAVNHAAVWPPEL